MGQLIVKMVLTLYVLLIQAVKILLATRDSLQREKENQKNNGADGSPTDTESQLDPIQVSCFFVEQPTYNTRKW